MKQGAARTAALTVLALIAFASNSVLGRLALGAAAIDAASYTSIRLASGALVLLGIGLWRQGSAFRLRGSWASAGALVLYALPFSYAYVGLETGMGALILFAAVQVTMIGTGILQGERPAPPQWLGLGLALTGLVYLLRPGLDAPPLDAALLMALAGVAWGGYSLLGRGSQDPLAHTASNFVRGLPIVLLVSLADAPNLEIEAAGAAYAVSSGALASGVGYAIWYAALRGLSATQASVIQLAVPVLAALGGLVFVAEALALRLVVATVWVLGGVTLALLGGRRSD